MIPVDNFPVSDNSRRLDYLLHVKDGHTEPAIPFDPRLPASPGCPVAMCLYTKFLGSHALIHTMHRYFKAFFKHSCGSQSSHWANSQR